MSPLTQDTAHLNRFYGLLNSLPIPQTKIAWACFLSGWVFLVAGIGELIGRPMSQGVLTVLLGFCLSLFGVASFDYKTKRVTDLDAIAAKGEADAKVAAATGPGVVTQEHPAHTAPFVARRKSDPAMGGPAEPNVYLDDERGDG